MGGLSLESGAFGRSVSVEQWGLRSPRLRQTERRDSVAKMAWDGLSTLVTKGKPKKSASLRRKQILQSRSFTPGSIATDDSVFMDSDSFPMETPESVVAPPSSTLEAIQESPAEAEAAARLAALRLSSASDAPDGLRDYAQLR